MHRIYRIRGHLTGSRFQTFLRNPAMIFLVYANLNFLAPQLPDTQTLQQKSRLILGCPAEPRRLVCFSDITWLFNLVSETDLR